MYLILNKLKNFSFYIYKFLRHRRYRITIPIARLIGKTLFVLPRSERYKILYPNNNLSNNLETIKKLKNEGIIISKLKEKNSIDSLKELQKELKIYEELPDSIKEQTFNQLNANRQHKKTFIRQINNYFSRSHLLCIAYDPDILQIVYEYFGFLPSIYKINVWHNQRISDLPSHTQLFHRDPEDVNLLKLFIPLKKINIENGPFQFISNSHNNYKNEEFTNLMSDRSSSKERLKLERTLEENYQENIVTFTGEPSDYCLVDTNGLHRGLLPVRGNRFLINIVYCSSYPHINKKLPLKFNPLIF